MKKMIVAAALFLAAISAAQTPTGVPMTVYIDPEVSNLPEQTGELLAGRLKAAIANSGMGATDDVTQFYLSAKSFPLEKHTVPGTPAKYFSTSEIYLYVIDAASKKEFASMSIETKGVGNSEQQAATSGIKEFKAANPRLIAFLKESNGKIIDYYNSQYRNIIAAANALALTHKYEEALFRLACVPEACIGYQQAVEAALDIYRKYLDDKSFKALAKARAIWNAGQDSYAAAEAGEWIAQVDPESKHYQAAIELNAEIKARVHSDIDYYRKLEERDAKWAHQETMTGIEAWKQVGVAYGNGQKSMYYKSTF
ncbi:MAG: hypothetical protein MJY44_00695 [Bacteroidales bacterium]|nr:hypothetical protein [Bacteroidales bacterium]